MKSSALGSGNMVVGHSNQGGGIMLIDKAISTAYQAKYDCASDTDRVRYLVDAVYQLAQIVDVQQDQIKSLSRDVNCLK